LPKYWVTLLRSVVHRLLVLGINARRRDPPPPSWAYNLAQTLFQGPPREFSGKGAASRACLPRKTAAHAFRQPPRCLPMPGAGHFPAPATAANPARRADGIGASIQVRCCSSSHKDFVWGLIASIVSRQTSLASCWFLTTVPIFRVDPGGLPFGRRGTHDRGVLRDRRLCDPETRCSTSG